MIEYKIIGRGLAGWHAIGGTNENITMRSQGGQLDEYLHYASPGALIYDASNSNLNDFIKFVHLGPLIDINLEPNEYKSFSDEERKIALTMIPALEGGFKKYAMLAQDKKFTGLDSVGIGIYEALLRKIPGIKIGRVIDKSKILWEGEIK